jgi:hypothetical protein
MSTSSITVHRPVTLTAAAAVVAAIAFGSVAVTVSQHTSRSASQPTSYSGPANPGNLRNAHFGSPTTGGHVVLAP